MRIRHWAGYGTINVVKVKDKNWTLHIRVSGNHEWGVVRKDLYDLYRWFVKRFDKNVPDYLDWRRSLNTWTYEPGWDSEKKEDTCDYMFDYLDA